MMELKEYQRGALDALARWLEALEDARRDSETTIEMLQQRQIDTSLINELRNYPKDAWRRLRENGGVAATAGEHVDRTDDANRPIPHICFKVPTGRRQNLTRCRRIRTPPLATRVSPMDRTKQGNLRPNKSRTL